MAGNGSSQPSAFDVHDDGIVTEELRREFEAAARRPLRQRFRYAFIRTYKPVMDDARSPGTKSFPFSLQRRKIESSFALPLVHRQLR
jgi:hypothetical protein